MPNFKVEVVSETMRTAKTGESWPCDASEWLKTINGPELFAKMEDKEVAEVHKFARNEFMIKPGMRYMEHVLLVNGVEMTSRFNVKIHDICVKYKIYSYLKEDTNESMAVNEEGKIVHMYDQLDKNN